MKEDLEEICTTKSFIIIIDKQLNESNGYLRSLHLLARLSEGRIRRVVVWEPGRNCNKPLDTSGMELEFVHPSEFFPSSLLHCVFTNDEKEEVYGYVDKYVEFGIPSILIVNHGGFVPKGWRLSGKPLEAKSPFTPRYFQSELNKYLFTNQLVDFQLAETKNLAFTEICYFHYMITQERAKTLTDLCSFEDERTVVSPIWDWAIALLLLKEENRVANIYAFIFNALRPLLERNKDVGKIATVFDSFLKRCRYDKNLISKLRRERVKKMLDSYLTSIKETNEIFFRSLLKVQLGKLGCL